MTWEAPGAEEVSPRAGGREQTCERSVFATPAISEYDMGFLGGWEDTDGMSPPSDNNVNPKP